MVEMTQQSCRTVEIIEAALGHPPLDVRFGASFHTHYALSYWRYFIGSYEVEPMPNPALILHLGGQPKVHLLGSDKSLSSAYSVPGDVAFVPSNTPSNWLINGEIEILLLTLAGGVDEDHPSTQFEEAPVFKQAAALGVKAPLVGELLKDLWSALVEKTPYVASLLDFLEQHLHRPTALTYPGLLPSSTSVVGPVRQIHELMLYIQQHFSENLSINDLAEQVHMAPSYLSQSFRKVAGVSPHRYILTRRIEAARSLLEGTGLSISAIAHETGFSSQSHLTTTFSKLMGMTPGSYRKRIVGFTDS